MIGSFGDVIFEASEDQIVSLNNQISRSYKAKISEHQAIYGPGMLRFQGRGLLEVSFTMTLVSSLIQQTTLKEELDTIKQMFELGEYPFLITELSEESSYFNKEEGGFDVVKLNITLKEYIENPKLYNQLIEQRKIQKNQQVTEENQDDIENEQKEAVNNDSSK